MSKLIGTSANQVPSNADLGSAAFMDVTEFLLSKGSSFSEISAIIPIHTATSMFLYDTTMDSDGGAWRKRCTHTSWYNQELNTQRRGSRREFPQYALIVAENSNTLRIYDVSGNTPEMWLTSTTTDIYGFAMNGVRAIHAMNGLVVIGQNDTSGSNYDGLRVLDFIRDDGFWSWNQLGSAQYGPVLGLTSGVTNISSRGWPFLIHPSQSIIAKEIYDIDMHVRPNAPIDPVTQMPVPTIGITTNSGVSVINHYGYVYDWSSLAQSGIELTDEKMYMGYYGNGRVYVEPQPKADVANYVGGLSVGSERHYRSSLAIKEADDDLYYVDAEPNEQIITGQRLSVLKQDKFAVGTNGGVSIFEENPVTPNAGMVAWIGGNYNTGYKLGDCVFAGMCDTRPGVLLDIATGRNHITNGTFNTDISGWAGDSNEGGSFTWNPAGYATITRGTGDSTYAIAQNISTLSGGEHVRVKFSIYPDNTGRIRVRLGGSKEQWFSTTLNANQWNTVTFTAIMEGGRIEIASNGGAGITFFHLDNVEIYEVEPDRRTDGRGAAIYGNITKQEVAPGAELVSYGGFSNLKYMEVPYIPDSELIGTGDFTIMGWVKSYTSQSYTTIMQHGNYGANSETGWMLRTNTNSVLEFRTDNSFANLLAPSAKAFVNSQWHHVCVTRRGGVLTMYIDNLEVNRANDFTSDLTSPGGTLCIGYNANDSMAVSQAPWNGELSMFKISKTAITKEQLAVVFETERRMFVDNAKVTLYGDNDDVTAVCFDPKTKLLHAGGAGGSSVFQDLIRIRNGEDAVTEHILASSGMVIEE